MEQLLHQLVIHPLVSGYRGKNDLFVDYGAWDGQVDHYAEWIKNHPESDTSREGYSQDNDPYYWQ